MIDTHCHLTFPDFAGRIPAVLEEAAKHGVTGAITVSTTTHDCLESLAIARTFKNVWCTAGVHPLYSDKGPHQWGNLRTAGMDSRCVAWGELGLDNHYAEPGADVQRLVLDEELAYLASLAAEGIVRPVVLHCREAFDDLIPILKSARLDPAKYVFHCFTGTAADARKVLDFGAWISFTGVLTYHNAEEVRQAARLVPDDRVMVETDAPYLSPDPHRGRRPCEPWMVSLTARRLAEVRGRSWEDFHEILNRNTRRFYGVPAAASDPDTAPAIHR